VNSAGGHSSFEHLGRTPEAEVRSEALAERVHEPATHVHEPAPERRAAPAAFGRAARYTLLAVMAYQGLTTPILGVTAPWVSKRFGLTPTALAELYALMSLSAFVTFGVARLADRAGRRRVLLWCLVSSSVMALGAALSSSIAMFATCELLRFSTVGALTNSAIALHAEAAPTSSARASAVGKIGMAAALGGASLLLVMPLAARLSYSYRWIYVGAASGVLLVPALLRWVPESARWRQAQSAGTLEKSSLFSVFSGRWSHRALAIIGASLLGGVEGAAVGSWSYYYGVSVVGLSPQTMSGWSLAATATGFAGYRVGMLAAERYGRVTTAVVFGLLHQAAALWLYLGPPHAFALPGVWIGIGLCLSGLGAAASGTAKTTASVELFPTPLRVTIMGYIALAGALATGLSNLLVAALVGPLGGVARAIALLSLTGVLSLVVFGFGVDETRGLSLDEAANEGDSRG
jgi:MFS family permease